MGTRQLRLSNASQIREKIAGFTGEKINIVLHNNTSLPGKLIEVRGDSILIENMRNKMVTFSLNTVAEIYVDSKA